MVKTRYQARKRALTLEVRKCTLEEEYEAEVDPTYWEWLLNAEADSDQKYAEHRGSYEAWGRWGQAADGAQSVMIQEAEVVP